MIKNQIKKIVLLAFFIVQINVLSAQGFGQSALITDWKFNLGDVRLGENESLDDSDWENVQVPHDWSVKQFASPQLASCTGYLPGGIGWYRTKINIPANSNSYYLYFEGCARATTRTSTATRWPSTCRSPWRPRPRPTCS